MMRWPKFFQRRQEPSGWRWLPRCTERRNACSEASSLRNIPSGTVSASRPKSPAGCAVHQDELLGLVVRTLEDLSLPYFVTGSMATILFGEPRFTNDIDVVVQLTANRVEALLEAFPREDFYADEEQIRQAVARRGQFNIIHPASGLKVDFMIPAMDEFDRQRFARARRVNPVADQEASFASPEDVILKKLQFFQEGGSEKHLRDIAGVLRISGPEVDRIYVEQWADRLGVLESWKLIVEEVESS